MPDERTVTNLIIGSGFVSWALSQRLSMLKKSFAVVDVSCLSEDLEVESSSEHLVDPAAVNKTARVGGGAQVWGGAFSWPGPGNWFANGDEAWLAVQEGFTNPGIPSYRGLRSWGSKARRESMAQSSRNPTLPFFELEGHLVPRGWKRFSKKVRGPKNRDLETASKLIDLKQQVGGGGIIEYMDKSLWKTISAQHVYLASGPIINAVLAHLMSGQSRFPMGNHWSRVVGRLLIETPRRLVPFARLKSTGKFVTYSSPSAPELDPRVSEGVLHHSLRLVPDGVYGSLRELIKSPSASSLMAFVRLRLGMPRSLSVLQMLDSGLMGDALMISSGKARTGRLRVKINFQMAVTDNCLRSADRLVEEFASHLQPWVSFDPALNPELSDAAHYWGSLPMMKSLPSRKQSVVDKTFELKNLRGVFALGASSFPLGSHGHPTFLAMLTAIQIK